MSNIFARLVVAVQHGRCRPGHYRLLESGGIAGNSYSLVAGLDVVRLYGTNRMGERMDILSRNAAMEVARVELAKRKGDKAAQEAQFEITWDGRL